MEGERALYLGRFQIFHKGHLEYVKFIDADPEVGKLVIAVGSAQYSRDNKHPDIPCILNPFTFEERETMLSMSLEGELQKPFEIVGIKDLHVCDLWFNLVMHYARPDVLYTNSRKEINLFESKGIPTMPVECREGYHAQVVREMVMHGDNWRKYVPPGTARFIEQHDIERILRDFYTEHQDEIEVVHGMQRSKGIQPYEVGREY